MSRGHEGPELVDAVGTVLERETVISVFQCFNEMGGIDDNRIFINSCGEPIFFTLKFSIWIWEPPLSLFPL